MSTMISFTNNKLSNTFLTEEDLRSACPMIFKTEKTNPKLSEKYVQATTIDVVRDMASLGWYPVETKQCRAKKGSSGIRSFHMIAFQNPDVSISDNVTGEIEAYPRIILTNSHDGFNSFKFMCGLFRLVCSNGLIVATKEFANVSIRHINYSFDELRKVVVDAVKNVKTQTEIMYEMKDITLTKEQQTEMATNAIKIRKGLELSDNLTVTDETINEILAPVRKEDSNDDLWTIFNRLQEHVIKGGFTMAKDEKSKPRKQRGITSVKKDIDINVRMFEMATSYLPAYSIA